MTKLKNRTEIVKSYTKSVSPDRFVLSSDMLDFDSIDADDILILIPFTSKVFSNHAFQSIVDDLQQKIRDSFSEVCWNDDTISGEYTFVIWKNDDGGFTYKIQFLADNDFGSGCYDTYTILNLSNKEIQILQPIVNNYFGK